MEDLDSYYGSGDLLVSLWRVARLDAFKDKYKGYMRAGGDSAGLAPVHAGVPGLLQTEDFAREVLSGAQTTAGNGEDSTNRSLRVWDGSFSCAGSGAQRPIHHRRAAFRRPAANARNLG